MFRELAVLSIREGKILRVDVTDGHVSTIYDRAGPTPDGVVLVDDTLYWTTMGAPTFDPARPSSSDPLFSGADGGLHAVRLDGTGARDLLDRGVITTGKQLAYQGLLYWGDREGCRVSRARTDGSELTDLVVNDPDDTGTQECVGVAVDSEHLYWTQKGPAKGGLGRILRAGLDLLPGETAAHRGDIETLWDRLPEPIDLELHGPYLYWTDRGAEPRGNTLNRAPIPRPGEQPAEPEILAGGFTETIGLAVDDDVAYVSDLGGRLTAVPLPESAGGPPRVIAELGQRLSGIAGIG
ncbi:hypothetical protein [Amycolatopsis jiangsuensis]|uniref:hypothetical protein n=1 Tax=Amycolatopsis jiangsuensis TaxID=1181879 RepID=UPI001609ECC9|nr:hypothetical protein [Amycolatopsis jiangsuensis]